MNKEQKYYEELIIKYDKKVMKLESILNKLEKALKDHKEIKEKTNIKDYYIEVDEVLDIIQELKKRYK